MNKAFTFIQSSFPHTYFTLYIHHKEIPIVTFQANMSTRRPQRASQVGSSRALVIRRNRRRGYASDDEDDQSALRFGSIKDLGEDAKFLLLADDKVDYKVILSRAAKLSMVENFMLPSKTTSLIVKAETKRKAKIRAAKRLEEQKNAMALTELVRAITVRYSQPRECIITHRIANADVFEKAFKSAFTLTEERGMEFVIRLLDYLKKDPRNAEAWNALPDKEARDTWLAQILP
ncbi:hypothetical protein GGI43DRAFT_399324 [Trichoderma evansii]